ncbi:DUF1772 domain-containing protein [Echinimonas agarilytica]|uniref:DUF1772 domain-containing protein n=1 Tax=Echinimonas agarilytica TaxID=1215918 RepID=A0AA42B8C5_9GAMM|nr:anthrone oxygenase family protein [Echinimonas agarilytica]MCM2680722.1 DUF1772 domain-containing protein [Echinimonas agarilytica]
MMVLLVVITGLMAGTYFAFSIFIMKSLAELPPLEAAKAMNKINDVIVTTLFLPIFFCSTIWFSGLFIWSVINWQNEQSMMLSIAAVIYVVGMLGVTVFGNVPLNNQLKVGALDDSSLVEIWQFYVLRWTRFNHIRMISCIASCALLTMAQAVSGR